MDKREGAIVQLKRKCRRLELQSKNWHDQYQFHRQYNVKARNEINRLKAYIKASKLGDGPKGLIADEYKYSYDIGMEYLKNCGVKYSNGFKVVFAKKRSQAGNGWMLKGDPLVTWKIVVDPITGAYDLEFVNETIY